MQIIVGRFSQINYLVQTHSSLSAIGSCSLRMAVILFIALLTGCASYRTFLRADERIVFFGDSITQLGVKPNGYIALVQDSLRKNHDGKNIEVLGAGISGNKVPDLQKRLQRDVLDKHPTIVVIYIGINDVWHWTTPSLRGTPKDTFEIGLKEIIASIQNAGARVILCTPSVIGEKTDGTNPQDAMLDEYSEISRRIAGETGSVLCDLHKAFNEYLKSNNPNNEEKGILTVDRVHLNDAGNRFAAEQILKILNR